jgi:hypothetical protein
MEFDLQDLEIGATRGWYAGAVLDLSVKGVDASVERMQKLPHRIAFASLRFWEPVLDPRPRAWAARHIVYAHADQLGRS